MSTILSSLSTGFNSLISNPTKAVGVATGINSIVTGSPAPSSNQALNNTSSASGSLASAGSSSMIWWIVGGIVAVVVVIFAVKK